MFADNSPENQEEWVNNVVEILSPRFGNMAKSTLEESIEPAVQRSLSSEKPEQVSGTGAGLFKFETTEMGTSRPKITNVRVHKGREDGQEDQGDGNKPSKQIYLDFDLDYVGDCDLRVSLLGVPGGVKDVHLTGRARLVLRPLLDCVPFVGGITACFLDVPEVEFDLGGLADVGDWPGLRKKVRRSIIDEVSARSVHPNRISVPTAPAGLADPAIARGFNPAGVILAKVMRAEGLPKKGGMRSLIGQDKPDPYVIISMGAEKGITKTIKNCCDPNWEEEGDNQWFEFPLETRVGHVLRTRLYDYDSLSRDEFMGKAAVVIESQVDEETSGEVHEVILAQEDDPNEKSKYDELTGELTISIAWIKLGTTRPSPESMEPFGAQVTAALVSCFVYSCNNLVELEGGDAEGRVVVKQEDLPTTRLSLTLFGETVNSEWDEKEAHPNFQFGHTFKVKAGQMDDPEAAIMIKAEDKTGNARLELALNLSELPMSRTLIQPDPANKPHVTITLSAGVKYLQFPEV